MCYWLDALNNKYVKLFPENECCEMGCRLRPKLRWLTELRLRRCVLQKSFPGHDLMLVTHFKILRVDTLWAYNQNVLGELTLQHRRAFSVSNIWALFNLKMELPVFWKMCAMISMCPSVQLLNGRGITAREAHLYLAVLPKIGFNVICNRISHKTDCNVHNKIVSPNLKEQHNNNNKL